jgi:plasmid maintenance system antidote protein VapI
MRYQLERYIKENTFMEENSFGKQLEEYARILKRTKKDLSEDLSIHYTRFSRIINDREEPNIELTYRLEQHSGGLIPALLWWKLIIKKQEHFLQQDEKSRRAEVAKVRNAVRFRA